MERARTGSTAEIRVKEVIFLLLFLLIGCGGPDIDLENMNLFGLPCSSKITIKEVVDAVGSPDDRAIRDRFLWRPSQLFLRYYRKGLEIGFDSEGRKWDPSTSNFRQAYIFLQPEDRFRAFQGSISHKISNSWKIKELERKFGPPEKRVDVWDEIEWHYDKNGEFKIMFIADKKTERIKAIMLIRKKGERKL